MKVSLIRTTNKKCKNAFTSEKAQKGKVITQSTVGIVGWKEVPGGGKSISPWRGADMLESPLGMLTVCLQTAVISKMKSNGL